MAMGIPTLFACRVGRQVGRARLLGCSGAVSRQQGLGWGVSQVMLQHLPLATTRPGPAAVRWGWLRPLGCAVGRDAGEQVAE